MIGVREGAGERRDASLDLLERRGGILRKIRRLLDPCAGEDQLVPNLRVFIEHDRHAKLLDRAGRGRREDLTQIRLVTLLRQNGVHEVPAKHRGEPVEGTHERRPRGRLRIALEARQEAELEELIDIPSRCGQGRFLVGKVVAGHHRRRETLDKLVQVVVEDFLNAITLETQPVGDGTHEDVGLKQCLEHHIRDSLRHISAHDVLEPGGDLTKPLLCERHGTGAVAEPLRKLQERDEERARRERLREYIRREELREDDGLVATATLVTTLVLLAGLLIIRHS